MAAKIPMVLVGSLATILGIGGLFLATRPPQTDEQFVERFSGHPDKQVQDKVGQARIRLAYKAAKEGDVRGAREAFLKTASTYRGTGVMSPEFGGVADGAAYQAAATFNLEGDADRAIVAFKNFMVEYPLSPLVYGAHKRLLKMDPSKSDEYDALLTKCAKEQSDKSETDRVTCGPKCLIRLAEIKGKKPLPYDQLAQICRTDKAGTTMAGMREGLSALGFRAFGYRLNKRDLSKLIPPALILQGEHYLVLTGRTPTGYLVFDPALDVETNFDPPKNPDFTLDVLSLYELNLEQSQ
ncbi:MAG TPA: cysteine peptidase family C39 domain-containing protein [Fimbriimonadaceae bacterium]|nr:cysteine peptidase family C39 domain-containing protein [Fimbriimonadaceae bacterium]